MTFSIIDKVADATLPCFGKGTGHDRFNCPSTESQQGQGRWKNAGMEVYYPAIAEMPATSLLDTPPEEFVPERKKQTGPKAPEAICNGWMDSFPV